MKLTVKKQGSTAPAGITQITCSASVKVTRKDPVRDQFVSIETAMSATAPVQHSANVAQEQTQLRDFVQRSALRDLDALSVSTEKHLEG